MNADDYVAFFCPNCGTHLNEVDLDCDDDRDAVTRMMRPNLGATVTCGWCGRRTNDWNHIKRCRSTNNARRAGNLQKMATDLVEILEETRA